jgi:hypothetical protein
MAIPASRLAQSLVTASPADVVGVARARVHDASAEAVLLTDVRGQPVSVIPAIELETATATTRLGALPRHPLTAVRPNTDLGLLIGDLDVEPRDAWFAIQDESGFTGLISPELVRAADALRRRDSATREMTFESAGLGPPLVFGGELWGEIEVEVPDVVYRCPNGHELPAEQASLHYDDNGNVQCPHDGTVMIRQFRQGP